MRRITHSWNEIQTMCYLMFSDILYFKPRVGSITDDNVKSNCFMIENLSSIGVCFLDFIATFAMSYQIFACFSFPNTKISENSDGARL